MTRRDFGWLALMGLTGCRRARIDPGAGSLPLSQFSVNISAGDLLDAPTAASRLARYLDEIAAAGYRKQIRIILPADWGPLINQHWFPVIRERRFKVLAILGQEKRDSAAMETEALAWVKHILPLVRGDLIGVQIVNEPAHTFTPGEYACYHRKIVPLVRALAPGVPIVAGDFDVRGRGSNTLDLWRAAVAAGAGDYDILSIHVTSKPRAAELADFARRLQDFAGTQPVWITEGDWGQLACLRAHGVPIDECFVYTWNDDAEDHLIRRPGGRLP